MTTVVFDGKTLASDGQITVGGGTITDYNTRKIFEVDGHLIGVAGRLSEALQFTRWFEEWLHYEEGRDRGVQCRQPEPFNRENFTAIVVSPDRSVSLFEGGQDVIPATAPIAIGSGSDFALAAMKAGADAEKAVEVAISLDPFSGGTIFTEKVLPFIEELSEVQLKAILKDQGVKIPAKATKEMLVALVEGLDG